MLVNACEPRAESNGKDATPYGRLKLNDPEGLERAAKAYAAIFPFNTMPTPEGTLLDDMAPRDLRAKAADPRQYVDMSFVQELESSGYLKQLYKR